MLFVLVAVAIGASVGLIVGRVLARREAPPQPASVLDAPVRFTERQLDELLAPYEHAA
jgi:hypothetical protein